MPMRYSGGSTGKDYSVNAPAIPLVGANFAATGTYANYLLVKTIQADDNHANIDIENTSGGQIVIVRDDGSKAAGIAPTNASVFALAAGGGIGTQGGSWSSQTFKGRLQVYALASNTGPISIMVD